LFSSAPNQSPKVIVVWPVVSCATRPEGRSTPLGGSWQVGAIPSAAFA
jgi:hypothetical protein